jgi:membrane fusion protein, copper/silver efflux system
MSKLSVGILLALTALIAAYGGYRYAGHAQGTVPPAPATEAASTDRKVLYWYDPMHPQQKFDKPGKSPFMDMQLVPKYADEAIESGTVSISSAVVQNLGIRAAPAETGSIEQHLEVVGSIAYNERGVVELQARAAGFVERLHARAPLDPVQKSAPLVDILFPEWAGAQEEYLLLRGMEAPDAKRLADAARSRLLLLGMTEAEISQVERQGRPQARITLTAPISGVIAQLSVREGMTITAGAPLFRIVDLSTVWVNADVPEAQARWVRPGAKVEARVAAYPETHFQGRVGALLPEVDPTTRTLRARIELANPGGRLKPGMFVTLTFMSERARSSVLVPSEAVIRTGTRSVVILALGEGRFRAVDVGIGAESGGRTEIRKGVEAGDQVVLSGQFLIDSEASLTATVERLAASTKPLEAITGTHKGRGQVVAIDAAAGRIELDHEPIPSLEWPRMQMEFVVENKSQLSAIKKGDGVAFELHAKPDKAGNYVIERIEPDVSK